MKKVRVLKELPFASVGFEFEIDDDFCCMGKFTFSLREIERWVHDDWLEWVEEDKSLEEKLGYHVSEHQVKLIAQIAGEHYKAKFDKNIHKQEYPSFTNLRNAMFGDT